MFCSRPEPFRSREPALVRKRCVFPAKRDTHIEDYEKVAKILVDETTQFCMSVVQDEQLHQLSAYLHEVQA